MLGVLQSVVDTISYLDMDSKMIGVPEQVNSVSLLFDIEGIDEKNNCLVVKNPALWQQMLDVRALMMANFYYSKENQITEEALRQLLRTALNLGYVDISELKNGTDMILRQKLQSLVQLDEGSSRFSGRTEGTPHLVNYKDLYTFSLGFKPDNWSVVECDSQEECIDLLYRQKADSISSSFIVTPYDFAKKEISISSKGKVEHLRTKINFDPKKKKYVLCFRRT